MWGNKFLPREFPRSWSKAIDVEREREKVNDYNGLNLSPEPKRQFIHYRFHFQKHYLCEFFLYDALDCPLWLQKIHTDYIVNDHFHE